MDPKSNLLIQKLIIQVRENEFGSVFEGKKMSLTLHISYKNNKTHIYHENAT